VDDVPAVATRAGGPSPPHRSAALSWRRGPL